MKREREVEENFTVSQPSNMADSLILLSKADQKNRKLQHYTSSPSPSFSGPLAEKNFAGKIFACKTCDREFSSFQALGGHRASHKKPRFCGREDLDPARSPAKPKTHECPICGVEFPTGQALGGHMRRHRSTSQGQEVKKSVIRIFGVDFNLMPLEKESHIDLKLQLMTCFH